MSSEFEEPYSESHLESPEYRKRLSRKLNTLIAVLEVACAKVRRSLAGPDADIERLHRIQKNLRDTLRVCTRAREALKRSEDLPADLPLHLGKASRLHKSGITPTGNAVEMSSPEEGDKFRGLGPIDPQDIRGVDLDDLCRQLLG